MAHWQFGFHLAANTSMTAATYVTVLPTYAINFGSGNRDALMQTIQVSTGASSWHIVDGFTASESDVCADPHPFYVRCGVTTGLYKGYNGVSGNDLVGDMRCHSAPSGATFTNSPFMATYNTSSPRPYEGLHLHFNHAIAVACNPVTIHFGSGAAVTDYSKTGHIKGLELCSVAPFTTGGGFRHLTPGSKLTLSAHNTTSTGHSWFVAINLKCTAVGFSDTGYLKAETTYF